MNTLPTELQNIIYKYKHQLDFSESLYWINSLTVCSSINIKIYFSIFKFLENYNLLYNSLIL